MTASACGSHKQLWSESDTCTGRIHQPAKRLENGLISARCTPSRPVACVKVARTLLHEQLAACQLQCQFCLAVIAVLFSTSISKSPFRARCLQCARAYFRCHILHPAVFLVKLKGNRVLKRSKLSLQLAFNTLTQMLCRAVKLFKALLSSGV